MNLASPNTGFRMLVEKYMTGGEYGGHPRVVGVQVTENTFVGTHTRGYAAELLKHLGDDDDEDYRSAYESGRIRKAVGARGEASGDSQPARSFGSLEVKISDMLRGLAGGTAHEPRSRCLPLQIRGVDHSTHLQSTAPPRRPCSLDHYPATSSLPAGQPPSRHSRTSRTATGTASPMGTIATGR